MATWLCIKEYMGGREVVERKSIAKAQARLVLWANDMNPEVKMWFERKK